LAHFILETDVKITQNLELAQCPCSHFYQGGTQSPFLGNYFMLDSVLCYEVSLHVPSYAGWGSDQSIYSFTVCPCLRQNVSIWLYSS